MTLAAANASRSCLISARAKACMACDMREVHRIEAILREATTQLMKLEIEQCRN